MKSFVALFALIAVANAGLIAPTANILQGPSSRTTLVGPEGSVISSIAPGGQIITEQNPGLIARSAPLIAAAPGLIARSPLWAAPSGIVAENAFGSLVAGPSGTIATSRTLAAPALIGHGLYL